MFLFATSKLYVHNSFNSASAQTSSQAQGARLSPSGISPFQAQLSPRVSQVSKIVQFLDSFDTFCRRDSL